MKKYSVQSRKYSEATGWSCFDNYVGDYVEADSQDEAITLYMDCLRDQIVSNSGLIGDELDAELNDLENWDYRATEVEW